MSRHARVVVAAVTLLVVACSTGPDSTGDATTAETTAPSSTTVPPEGSVTAESLTAEEIHQIYGDGLARLCRSALCADRPLYVSLRPDTPEIRRAILDVKPQAQFIGPDERVGPVGGPVPDRGIILGFQWDPTTDTRRVQIEAGWATTPTTGEGFRYIYQWNGTSWEWYDTKTTYMS
jgi:hypothetical protein